MARKVARIIFDDGTEQVVENIIEPVLTPVSIGAGIPIIGGFLDGIPDADARSYANTFHLGWVRTWHAIRDWNSPPAAADFNRERYLKSLGLKILSVFTPIEAAASPTGIAYPSAPTDPTTVQKFFTDAASAAAGAVDAWEVFNEPNLSNYNPNYNALKNTIGYVLRPAYLGLKSKGQYVIGASWSGDCNTDGFKYFLSGGYLDTCDAVGYHPYGTSPAQQIERVSNMAKLINGRGIWLTEWNLHMDEKTPEVWGTSLAAAAYQLRAIPTLDAVFHFRMVRNNSRAGVAAPFLLDNGKIVPRMPWYDYTEHALATLV